MLKKNKKIFLLLVIVSVTLILGYIVSASLFVKPETFIPHREKFMFFDIFLKNISSNIILLAIAALGPIALLIVMNILFSLGAGVHMSQVLYSTTLPKILIGFLGHTTGEVITLAIVMWISIQVTIAWIKYLFSGEDWKIVKKAYREYYSEKIINIVIIISVVLLFSSIVEVYWSAPYFDKLYIK
ncbi:MAG: stage II sporulation protein M [Clostridiaceae bacterium]